MTAEIAILNKSAVALAADSKVTVGGRKTFDTVSKIFTLSKVHPVGLMVFNNSEFMGYPWELIVKLYRSQKGDASETHVYEWAKDFIRFVKGFGQIRQEDRRSNLIAVLSSWFGDIIQEAAADAEQEEVAPFSPQFVLLLKVVIESRQDMLSTEERALTKARMDALYKEFGDEIDEGVQRTFGPFKDAEVVKSVSRLVPDLLARKLFSPISSGLVIAGFGSDEIFPSLVHYESDGYIGARAKIEMIDGADISRDFTAGIYPFAQSDMVQRFMDGIDPEYKRFWIATLGESLIENCLVVLDEYGHEDNITAENKEKIRAAVRKTVHKCFERSLQYQRAGFSGPIMDIVNVLPKEELPNLAEALVELTSLKRHISSDIETVGGPVDVALISKTDGFIWIKRKHYFRPELNQQFARNYMRDVDKGETDGKASRSKNGKGKAKK